MNINFSAVKTYVLNPALGAASIATLQAWGSGISAAVAGVSLLVIGIVFAALNLDDFKRGWRTASSRQSVLALIGLIAIVVAASRVETDGVWTDFTIRFLLAFIAICGATYVNIRYDNSSEQ